jgi:hypothetical protein
MFSPKEITATILSEAPFAKVVVTPQGPGILIAGEVYVITAPVAQESYAVATALVSVLRGGGDRVGIAQGVQVVGITPGASVGTAA